jgi:hypothetical protein
MSRRVTFESTPLKSIDPACRRVDTGELPMLVASVSRSSGGPRLCQPPNGLPAFVRLPPAPHRGASCGGSDSRSSPSSGHKMEKIVTVGEVTQRGGTFFDTMLVGTYAPRLSAERRDRVEAGTRRHR